MASRRMSQADAMREVWRVVMTTLDGDLANGSDWIYAPERSLADIARIESAIKRVRDIARKRSESRPDAGPRRREA